MAKGGRNHFEEFEDHTLLKHLILDKYVKSWAQKLLSWAEQVWFVDAFAGEGGDQKGRPGSPLIASRIAEDLLFTVGLRRGGKAPMRILAVERDEERCKRLEAALQSYIGRKPPIAAVRCGTLSERLDVFIQHVGKAPVLFFLDPFGVDGLLVDDLPKLLSGPQNEVFALFSDVGAKRLHATLLTEERDVDYEVQQVQSAPSLFPDMDEEAAASKKKEVERSTAALRSTQQASQRILVEALGPSAIAEVDGVSADERPARLTQIYLRRLREAGAKFVISFPVRDRRSSNVYQLVHGSKSKAGLRTMKESMQSALNGSSLPLEVREAISFELRGNEDAATEEIRAHFKGKEIRWTVGNNRGDEVTVKKYLLEETPIFPGQFETIKQALIDAGQCTQRRPLTFNFI